MWFGVGYENLSASLKYLEENLARCEVKHTKIRDLKEQIHLYLQMSEIIYQRELKMI